MDSMELEREKGITIQSAATYCHWKGHNINIIDTPGHVDFTIEVERALRVLDSAVLVVCGVSGVQSQTMTVDRQMKRYNIPRLVFINKLDRMGANPIKVLAGIRKKLKLTAALLHVPVGSEDKFKGVIDLVSMKLVLNSGAHGEQLVEHDELPLELIDVARQLRRELIETLADVDDEIGEYFLEERTADLTTDTLRTAIRRATIKRTFVPVLIGSAYKNIGVQNLLDAVLLYLPDPSQVKNTAYYSANEEGVAVSRPLTCVNDSGAPLVAYAFKLDDGKYGQLTYIRIYQGTLSRGLTILNSRSGKRLKVARLVRMHSNEMEDVDAVGTGEIAALFGVDCFSGDTFTDVGLPVTASSSSTSKDAALASLRAEDRQNFIGCFMSSMFVPEPVVSLSIAPKKKDTSSTGYTKALQKFQKEDPTFRVHFDVESKETIISGMGELHLEIYVERMRREYGVDVVTGKPKVAFKESISAPVDVEYVHKKQSGGAGQFAKVIGRVEPILDLYEEFASSKGGEVGQQQLDNEFVNEVVSGTIPTIFIPACEKGFLEVTKEGPLLGSPIVNMRFILQEGQAHAVDSNEHAFRTATMFAIKSAFSKVRPVLLEPIMKCTITVPSEYQGVAMSCMNKRKGVIVDTEILDESTLVHCEVPLNMMFGFMSELRGATQGKGEFTMEYKQHAPCIPQVQEELVAEYLKKMKDEEAKSF